MRNYWVRWYGGDAFEYDGPWWLSGWSGENLDVPIFVAAVRAKDERAAKKVIEDSYDDHGRSISEWSFCNERPDDWEPFCDRFPRVDWMQWPAAPATPGAPRGTTP